MMRIDVPAATTAPPFSSRATALPIDINREAFKHPATHGR
jgi:hypothetical protein